MKRAKFYFIAAALLFAWGWLGSVDYESELLERRYYCQQVAKGAWPDYRKIAAAECGHVTKQGSKQK